MYIGIGTLPCAINGVESQQVLQLWNTLLFGQLVCSHELYFVEMRYDTNATHFEAKLNEKLQ